MTKNAMTFLNDQNNIHNFVKRGNLVERKKALIELVNNFAKLPNKDLAWDDLLKLGGDSDDILRSDAIYSIGTVFKHVSDKEKVWDELHRLSLNEDKNIRCGATYSIGSAFSEIHDKDKAWEDLNRLSQDEDLFVRNEVTHAISLSLSFLKDKNQAYEVMHKLAYDEKSFVREGVAEAISSIFSIIPNREQACKDLYKIALDEDRDVRIKVAYTIGSVFSFVTNKNFGWEVFFGLLRDKDPYVRKAAAKSFKNATKYIPEENHVWNDLNLIIQDEDCNIRKEIINALCFYFPVIPDKNRVFEDLFELLQNKKINNQICALRALSSAFSIIGVNNRLWFEFIKLLQDANNELLDDIINAICLAFPLVTDKEIAWKSLHNLIKNNSKCVKYGLIEIISLIIEQIPDKNQAWIDLHAFTKDENDSVRKYVTEAIGLAYPHIPNKNQAWEDLILLSQNTNNIVRAFAYHSLGRASIFKATEAENEEKFKKELEKSIDFFANSAKISIASNPASFCLPFYRSFYSITFHEQDRESEVEKYIIEAKKSVKNSKSKEILLEAVKNIQNALEEVQKLQEIDFNDVRWDLNTYRKYCERAANLLDNTGNKAPGATKIINKGLPIIDQYLKDLIAEIQNKAEKLCKQTRETPLENLGLETNKSAKKLSSDKYLYLEVKINSFAKNIHKYCEYFPSNIKSEICKKIENINNMDTLVEKAILIAETQDEVLKCIENFDEFPHINNIFISKREKEIIRIAVIQLCFELSTASFPPHLKDKDETKRKIFLAIEKAQNERAEIVCFPELCFCEEWLTEVEKKFSGMIIIPGSYYDIENHNICSLILESYNLPPQLKVVPSAFESSNVMGSRMKSGDKIINIYETKFGKFAVLICRDFGNFIPFLRGKLDIIFVPSYNPSNKRFHKDADNHVTNSPSYVIISNTAIYGGTSIFGQLDKSYFFTLEQGGCKNIGDNTYKICEIEKGKEGIIIADFNLVHKSPQIQKSIALEEEIISIENIQKLKL